MIHILLLILKIFGIVLLAVLCLIFLILFFPITYTGKFQIKKGMYNGSVTVGWLFHIIHFKGKLRQENVFYVLRIFGIPVLSSKRKRKADKSEKDKKQLKVYEKDEKTTEFHSDKEKMENSDIITEESVKEKRIKVDSFDNISSEKKEKTVVSEKKKADFRDRIRKFLNEVKEFFVNTKRKIKKYLENTKSRIKNRFQNIEAIYNKIKEINDFIRADSTKEAFRYGKNIVIKFIKHIFPKRIRAKVHYGFDTPDVTGRVLGYIAMGYGTFGINPKHILVEPDFENKFFDGKIKCKGYIFLGVVGIYILKFYFRKEIHDIIKKFS